MSESEHPAETERHHFLRLEQEADAEVADHAEEVPAERQEEEYRVSNAAATMDFTVLAENELGLA